ncbi:hypothetical protein Dimus_020089 [Dionaea muscipula]
MNRILPWYHEVVTPFALERHQLTPAPHPRGKMLDDILTLLGKGGNKVVESFKCMLSTPCVLEEGDDTLPTKDGGEGTSTAVKPKRKRQLKKNPEAETKGDKEDEMEARPKITPKKRKPCKPKVTSEAGVGEDNAVVEKEQTVVEPKCKPRKRKAQESAAEGTEGSELVETSMAPKTKKPKQTSTKMKKSSGEMAEI